MYVKSQWPRATCCINALIAIIVSYPLSVEMTSTCHCLYVYNNLNFEHDLQCFKTISIIILTTCHLLHTKSNILNITTKKGLSVQDSRKKKHSGSSNYCDMLKFLPTLRQATCHVTANAPNLSQCVVQRLATNRILTAQAFWLYECLQSSY